LLCSVILFISIYNQNPVEIIPKLCSKPSDLSFQAKTIFNINDWEIQDVWNTIGYNSNEIGSQNDQNSSIIVAIIDSGINKSLFSNHFFPQEYWGWDFINNNPIAKHSNEFNSHGTFIANLFIQMVPSVQIMDVRVLNENNRNPNFEDFALAIEYVLQFPEIKIIQLSSEFIETPWNSISPEILWTFTKAYLQNVTIVSVTGNGKEPFVTPPGRWAETIAVSAVTPTPNGSWSRAQYANYGKNIDIVAPGNNIPSIDKSGNKIRLSGTSFASSFVGSSVALMLMKNPLLTPVTIRNILHQSAIDLEDCTNFGAGLLNVSKALELTLNVTNSEFYLNNSHLKCSPDYIIPEFLPAYPITTSKYKGISIEFEIAIICSSLILLSNRKKKVKRKK
jgi:subtilisin family serine protease